MAATGSLNRLVIVNEGSNELIHIGNALAHGLHHLHMGQRCGRNACSHISHDGAGAVAHFCLTGQDAFRHIGHAH